MHLIQEEIGLPRIQESSLGAHHSTFTVSPLPQGYGTTLGNAMRRAMLSSLPGVSVTGIRMKGVSHEYMVVKGVKDSFLDIMLNLKQLAISMEGTEKQILKLKKKESGDVIADDIEVPAGVQIHNPELVITSLDKGGAIDIELRIEKNVGYRPALIGAPLGSEADMIEMDGVFTPLKRIHYSVDNVRVGQRTDLDKLTLEIKTNGSISPADAYKFAVQVMESYFKVLGADSKIVEPEFMSDFDKIAEKARSEESGQKNEQKSYTPIEILGLSPRTLNALINGGIGSIEELCKCSESKLQNLRGFGKKALTEVAESLEKRGYEYTITE